MQEFFFVDMQENQKVYNPSIAIYSSDPSPMKDLDTPSTWPTFGTFFLAQVTTRTFQEL